LKEAAEVLPEEGVASAAVIAAVVVVVAAAVVVVSLFLASQCNAFLSNE
jgi:hypothetical protein